MSRPSSLLFVLTPQETREFLPAPLLEEMQALAGHCTTLDPTGLSPEEFHQALAQANPEVLVGCWKTPPLPAQLPPGLRYVCYLVGSVRRLITPEHLTRGLLVTNWGGSISRTVAECALFHTLAGLRRAAHWTLAMHRDGAWKQSDSQAASLFGRRVGLHGFGQIARELVRLLRPFGCAISVFAPDVGPQTERDQGIRALASLDALFAENDVVVELAPLIPETTGIVTERHLRLLPPGSVFVNVGRGAVVDEAALLRVAREGNILVGLDVYGVEPLPRDSGFRGLPNVMLTPHLAGPTTDRRRDAGEFALANLRAYAAGEPLRAVVDARTYASIT